MEVLECGLGEDGSETGGVEEEEEEVKIKKVK